MPRWCLCLGGDGEGVYPNAERAHLSRDVSYLPRPAQVSSFLDAAQSIATSVCRVFTTPDRKTLPITKAPCFRVLPELICRTVPVKGGDGYLRHCQ